MKLDNLPAIIKSMDRALYNINTTIYANISDKEQAERGEFKRFEKRQMSIKFSLFREGKKVGDNTHKAFIHDVSAGGMSFVLEGKCVGEKGDSLDFEIYKVTNHLFLKGKAKLVRQEEKSNKTMIAVAFTEVGQ